MAGTTGFFDAVRQYTAQEWARALRAASTPGVVQGIGNALAVTAGPGLGVTIDTGFVTILGNWRYEDAATALALLAADPTNPRIDRIIARLTISTKTVELTKLTGTPAGSPVAPTLTQGSDVYEVPLAQIAVAANAASITSGNVTDQRQYSGSVLSDHGHTGVAGDGGAFGYGASVASAASVTLPTTGKRLAVTGTTKINTIAAGPVGREVTLEFGSAGCRVGSAPDGSGGNVYLHGPFSSLVTGTLSLYCSGSVWIETARSRYRVPTVLLTRVTTLALGVGFTAVPLTGETEDGYGLFAPTANIVTVTAETAGLWDLRGMVQVDTTATGQRGAYFVISGTSVPFGFIPASTVTNPTFTGARLARLAVGATVGLQAYSDQSANLLQATLDMRWLEP